MERLQNLKCLDTHFWAVELIVWVVFLVLFNTVSDRQSAVVPLVCSILLVLISNFMNADEKVIKLKILNKGENSDDTIIQKILYS